MLKLTIKNCKSKPTGHIYHQKKSFDVFTDSGIIKDERIVKSWISQGGDYLKWKAEQVKLVKQQLPPDYQTKSRVWGVVARICLAPNRKGHPPDLYNLIGSIADILTQAEVWTDDHVNVSDLSHQRIIYNQKELTTVFVCETIMEYSSIVLDELYLMQQFIQPT